MEGRGFGFVTFTDPAHAQSFLEVYPCDPVTACLCHVRPSSQHIIGKKQQHRLFISVYAESKSCLQTRQHIIDGKKVEAKAAVPRNSGSGNSLTKKMFVGGTVSMTNLSYMSYMLSCDTHSLINHA